MVSGTAAGTGTGRLPGRSPASEGWDRGILRTASEFCREHALYLELGTGGFGFEDISMKLQLARDAGARSLRTFYGGHRHLLSAEDIRRMVREAAEGLKRLADVAAASDVILAIENHEEFTGAEVFEIITAVDSPCFVRACLDTGNGMIVGEDPLECTRALAPYASCVHLKDWVVVQEAECRVGRTGLSGRGMQRLRRHMRTSDGTARDSRYHREPDLGLSRRGRARTRRPIS